MNKDQVLSLVRTLLKVGGSALAAHGMSKAAAWLNAEDVVGAVLTLAGVIWSHCTHKDETAAQGQKPAPGLSGTLSLLVFLAAAGLLMGCQHPTLEPGGAYAPVDTNGVATAVPDYGLYLADSAFKLAHDAALAVFEFERQHRATLWQISPTIKHSLDQARADAKKIDLKYALARQAYLASPVPANLSALQTWLQEAQQMASVASAVLSTYGQSTNFAPAVLTGAPTNGPPAK